MKLLEKLQEKLQIRVKAYFKFVSINLKYFYLIKSKKVDELNSGTTK